MASPSRLKKAKTHAKLHSTDYQPSVAFRNTLEGITSLQIQGASNVRKAAMNALSHEAIKVPASNPAYFAATIRSLSNQLIATRPTEPELQSGLHQAYLVVQSSKNGIKAKQHLLDFIHQFEDGRTRALARIAREGVHLFSKPSIVLTHCHSHSALEIIKLAHENGKIRHVYCTESRPLYQGRLTAKDLTDWKIPCTQIVDSAIRSLLAQQKINVFLTGADALIPQGLINKVGTSTISMACREHKIPHIVAASSLKFVKKIEIEERSADEVWQDRPNALSIYNPAFDLTPQKWIKGVITENGLKKKW